MEDSWSNPFREEHDSLVNIATGAVAPVEIASDLMNAHKVGKDAYQEFKTGRLEKDDPVDFYAPMKKQKSKTFSEMYTEKVKCKGKEIVMKADRKLFGHMVVVAQSRKLDMKEILSHPLGPIRWALAKGDGSLAKTDKSKLMSEIGKNVPVAENIAGKSACIIDGMSVVQKLNGNNKTFRDFAISVFKNVLWEAEHSDRVDVVFDVYRETSIKDAVRANRGSWSGIRFKSISPGHKIKQWRSFLSEAHNKTVLIEYITDEWNESETANVMIKDKTLFVTCGENCWKINRGRASLVEELQSSQEEADTRMVLHAKHASDHDNKTIIVVSEDTYVFVLCISLANDIQGNLYQKRATKARTVYMDIKKLRSSLGSELFQTIIGFSHVYGLRYLRECFLRPRKIWTTETTSKMKRPLRNSQHWGQRGTSHEKQLMFCRLSHVARMHRHHTQCMCVYIFLYFVIFSFFILYYLLYFFLCSLLLLLRFN